MFYFNSNCLKILYLMIMIKIKIFPSWRMVPNCFVKSNTEHCFKLNDKVMLQLVKSEDF